MSSFCYIAPGQTEFRRRMDNVHVNRHHHHQTSLNGLEKNLPEANKQCADLTANIDVSLRNLHLRPINVLMVAEKPLVARTIAKILSGGRCRTWRAWNGCSISVYKGMFREQQANFKVTSTCGHVMGVDFPAQYNYWDQVDPAELFDCQIERKEANPKLKMPAFLAAEAENYNYLVLWLDCDKEGENICFEVIEAVRTSMRPLNGLQFMDVVFRAHFSALTETELIKAMENLGSPNKNKSLSVDARAELDLRIGCAFTRFQSGFLQKKYGDLDSNLISYGPCQTPTLAFCVDRHDEISRFVPQPYWLLQVEVELPEENRTLKLEWIREDHRQFNKTLAQDSFSKIEKFDEAIVVDVSQKDDEKENPVALHTLELLRYASSSLGLAPIDAMSVAERLYVRGYISYPRTETTAYPDSFDFMPIIRELDQMPQFTAITRQLMADGFSQPKNGENKGDHPPITPIKAARDEWLSGDDARIYEYIAQHFLASLMRLCKYITKTVKFTINQEQFMIYSRDVTDPGFTAVFKWMAVTQKEMLDSIQTGQRLTIKKAQLVKRMTTPDDYLTESELIHQMEIYGIGTDGSVPVHINNICVRNYVKVVKGRRLVPTKLGIALVRGYQRVDPDLIHPEKRADVEKNLELIAESKVDYESMKNQILEEFREKFNNVVRNINLVNAPFEDSFTALAECGRSFSKCGNCKNFMKLIETRPKRLYCPTCEQSYYLPSSKGSSILHHFDRTCPVDGFDLLYRRAGDKLFNSFAFCPHCYKTQGGVLPCMNHCAGGRGVLVLDLQSGPKWRLCCDKCPAVVGLFEGASKLRVLDLCGSCEARRMHVEYKDAKSSKLPDQALHFDGCIFCERQKLHGCVKFITHSVPVSGRGRGCGRGSGRGRGWGGGGERSGSNGREGNGRGRGGDELVRVGRGGMSRGGSVRGTRGGR